MSKQPMKPEAECSYADLHLIGEIQGYGALVCIDNSIGRVIACSANTSAFLGLPFK